MTISVESLLEVVSLVVLAFLVLTWVWAAKSNNSKTCRIARFFTHIALTAIEIGLLKVSLLNSESSGVHFFLSYFWLCRAVIQAFSLNND